jgi:hypothetical protein
MEILWWFTAIAILFVFFGGVTSIILAWLVYLGSAKYFAKKDLWPILAVGFVASGGVSYWLCRYAMGNAELSPLDTAVAVTISLLTFTITVILLLFQRPLARFLGKHKISGE